MKRKRKEVCPSPILEESPKRVKVHAQRKFAQNSGSHNDMITPIHELDSTSCHTSVMPEPVELLPMKRPNTEDFLTFLCFRGTPILPTNLQFFNTASIVSDGQVHEIKGESSPRNGPIDIAKCAGSSEKPFIAFGVRKRADPIVISRQMERKRRHALAIQALRRKYQEQKMAKIRALTISKLSEKTTNKTLVKTNTIQKTETVTKKTQNNTLQKTKVIATKHVKVTTRTLKTSVKPKMCLRSFRGKFVQKELPFRAIRSLADGKVVKKRPENKVRTSRNSNKEAEPAPTTTKKPTKPANSAPIKLIKRRILIPSSTMVATIVKPKLRSTTTKKTVISRRKALQRLISTKTVPDTKESPGRQSNDSNKKEPSKKSSPEKNSPPKKSAEPAKKPTSEPEGSRRLTRRDSELTGKTDSNKKETTKNVEMKRQVKIAESDAKKVINKKMDLKKEFNLKSSTKEVKKKLDMQKTRDTTLEKKQSGQKVTKDVKTLEMSVKKIVTRKGEADKEKADTSDVKKEPKKNTKTLKTAKKDDIPKGEGNEDQTVKKKPQNAEDATKRVTRDSAATAKPKKSNEGFKKDFSPVGRDKDQDFSKKINDIISNVLKDADLDLDEDSTLKTSEPQKLEASKAEEILKNIEEPVEQKLPLASKKDDVIHLKEPLKKPEAAEVVVSKPPIKKPPLNSKKDDSPRRTRRSEANQATTSRPSRKTKEAAALYMEILSHKLVGDIIDDDNVSIDSFPELPNVKKTEQREIELKAQAKTVEDEKKTPPEEELGLKKSNPLTVASDSESDNEVLQAKIAKRQTRRANQQNNKHSGSGGESDESFHLDVRVPRKKKVTRSKNRPVAAAASVLEKNVDIILEAARVLEAEKPLEVPEVPKPPKKKYKGYEIIEESDSDESTTSDINLKSLQAKQRNKKLSKTKCSKSSKAEFSDSDEEPLVKLKSVKDQQKPKPKKTAASQEVPEEAPKPKRECTKRPSNYLPMFSSSDEDDDDEPYFHGFNPTKEELNKPKVFVQSLAPSLDLLSKDIGRKGKVNMSNEQIEQWLKDSALAGSSVAKENDAMLKFGEKIPAEVPKVEPDVKIEPVRQEDDAAKPPEAPKPSKSEVKSPPKWIFKKDKKDLEPNKNAFSPENECSVYAFGEENEEVVSTPFRRPSRRPSSTATSRSEDEMTKNDEAGKQGQFRKPSLSDLEDSRCFNIPQNPTKLSKPLAKSDTMVPPSSFHPKRAAKTSGLTDKFPEPFDDCKYKIPSSPSASSGSSAKLYKKGGQKQKGKLWEPINPVYVSDFPKPTDPAKLVEAPVFHPTEQEFQDPLEYIERIRHKAEQFGVCKIVPPSSFKPECKVSDDMRFTAFNQYVHKMLHRWGPNFKEFIAIRKYLATQSISLKTPPLIGGMEIDLPRLYQTVQSLGGLKEVIEKKKWSKVSDHMKIPKSAQDRVTKLDDIYCKYLLPYDTLSPAEREKLFDEVETFWAKRESRHLQEQKSEEPVDFDSDDNELDECTMKGKNMALNALYRIARNTMAVYFKAEPTALEAEQEFWRYVTQKQNHICVHSASIDCGTWGYGFAVSKNSPFAKHPWNLKVLSNNNGSVLRSLGPVMGVTIPTLHVGMVFSACCWYRDPHGLPWVEYLHTGGNKIWYGIPSASCEVFHAAMQKLVPTYCRDKELWLPSDTAMVPPGMLLEQNVSLCRTIQEPGQFIVVFPKVFTSSISTGYVVSESVYFAPLHWLKTAKSLFTDLKTSCEPSMFSLDKLFACIANDARSSVDALRVILPFVVDLVLKETENRRRLREFGDIEEEKMSNVEPPAKKKKIQSVDGDFECEVCRMNLYVSMIIDTQDDLIYCLEDALKLLENNAKTAKNLKLKFSLSEYELNDLPKKINLMIDAKLQKRVPGRFAGMPTLLK